MPPRIALLAAPVVQGNIADWTSTASATSHRYLDAVVRAGGDPVVLPCPEAGQSPAVRKAAIESSTRLLDIADGVLFLGGGDVDPARYAEPAHARLGPTHDGRDEHELVLAAVVRERRVPTLAICRGMQLMNVAFGGSLHQHLPDVAGMQPHAGSDPSQAILHDASVVANTRLASIVGASLIADCSSVHHQGIDRMGNGLVASAHTGDGLIEAVEPSNEWWMIAVQWHPERTAATDLNQQAIFNAFIAEAGHHVN